MNYRNIGQNYEISENGDIRCLKKYGYRDVKTFVSKNGYVIATICLNKKSKTYYIHHLVAKCFLGEKPNEKLVIDHIDQNKQNNNYTNLRYLTQKDNLKNSPHYRSDILETDSNKRKLILLKECYHKNKIQCECGSIISTYDHNHKKTKKHINFTINEKTV